MNSEHIDILFGGVHTFGDFVEYCFKYSLFYGFIILFLILLVSARKKRNEN